MITIINSQRAYTIDTDLMEQHVTLMLEAIEYPTHDIGILLCGKYRMRRYNKTFRNKDYATDVLSFPYNEGRNPETSLNQDENVLGDIILCPHMIAQRSKAWNRSFDEHLIALLAHGIAHLLGHDHHTEEDHIKMNALETHLIEKVSYAS